MILRPAAVDVGAIIDQLGTIGDLGVQIVELMYRDRFQGHRQFRAAEFVLAMVTDDHVLDLGDQLFGKGLAILLDKLSDPFWSIIEMARTR